MRGGGVLYLQKKSLHGSIETARDKTIKSGQICQSGENSPKTLFFSSIPNMTDEEEWRSLVIAQSLLLQSHPRLPEAPSMTDKSRQSFQPESSS